MTLAITTMYRTALKSKIHRATVPACDLDYVGSLTLDGDLLDAAHISEYEQVQVVDLNNGARFETYVIVGASSSGQVQVNGAAARLVHRGDLIIVFSYALYSDDEFAGHTPEIILVDCHNRPIR